MTDILSNMYDTTEFHNDKNNQPNQTTVSVKQVSMLKEVEINGTKFYSIDPAEFAKMDKQLKFIKQRMEILEQRIKVMDSVLRDKDVVINQLRRELDTKIGYS